MTENEAIEALKLEGGIEITGRPIRLAQFFEGIDSAIKALEEVQQYRQIGTVSTCRNAVGICKTMIERGINPDNITECIKFEYNLVQRGYDLKNLIEIIEEHKQQFQIGTVEKFRETVEKQTKKKPEFLDTRFMYNGKHISDGCQLQKCYKCPNCNHHIFHVWDDELYCKYCGQYIDWRANDENTD